MTAFDWLINSAVYASVTALFIILFKLIFKNKIKARWHFLIWAILLIRLAVPVLPSTPLSVFNAVKVEQSVIEQSPYQAEVKNDIEKIDEEVENEPEITQDKELAPSTHTAQKSTNTVSADRIIVFIWLSGSAILIIYFAVVFAVFDRRLKKRRRNADGKTMDILSRCKTKLNITKDVGLYFADTTPTLIGLFSPKIYIPDDMSEAEHEAVLTHELCHMTHLDILWSLTSTLVLCLNWYNPVIWLSFFMFKRDIEVYCDERTLKHLDDKQSYAMLLLKTATKNRYILGTSSLQSGKSDVKRRIRYLAKFKKPKAFIIYTAAIIAMIIAVICLTNATANTQSTEFTYDMNIFTRTLTIKGSGEMPDYEYLPPWYNFKTPINIKVENGITSLSAHSLSADIDGNTGKPRNNFQYTERVELPNTLKEIGSFAFLNCLSLQEIDLPESVTEIGEGAFKQCGSLKVATIPEGVTNISDYLFDECESLESVKLSSKTKKIGFCAFSNTALTEIDIPDTVEEIGFMAFYDCQFKSVTIPKSVVSIEENAFGYGDDENYRISKIEDFTIRGYKGTAAEKYAKENGFTFIDAESSNTNGSYSYDTSTQTFTITGVKKVEPFDVVYYKGSNADMVHEKEVMSVGWIEDYKLVPNSTTELWGKTITGIPKTINISEGVKSIGSNAFSANIEGTGNNFEHTEKVILPDSLTEISQFAFSHCESISDIDLPKNLTEIGSGAFLECKSLKSLTIPDGIEIINRGIFSCCESLETANISNSSKIIVISDYAFYKTKLKDIILPEGMYEIGDYSFYGCEFTEVTIPESVFTIGEKAFGYNGDGKIEGFTVKGKAGTTAEWYAKENGFKFEEIK